VSNPTCCGEIHYSSEHLVIAMDTPKHHKGIVDHFLLLYFKNGNVNTFQAQVSSEP